MAKDPSETRFGAHLLKGLVAEFVGTFALIFIGAGAVVALSPDNITAIALAHGFVIMAFAYAFGNESNSYLNPALTLGVVVAGEADFRPALPGFVAQFLGGIAGGYALLMVYGAGAPHNLGMTTINTSLTTIAGGLFLEGIGTFFLMTAVLNTALRGAAGKFAPFAIGMTVAFCIMAFGGVTGASVNPARTLGPAMALGNYQQVGLYMLAQFGGAVVAAGLYRGLFKDPVGDEKKQKADNTEPAF